MANRRPEPERIPHGIARADEPQHRWFANLRMRRPRGTHRRFARQLREAALRATDDELEELHRLERLVRLEALCVLEASDTVRGVIRVQHAR